MAAYLEQSIFSMLEQAICAELAKVNMQEITTFPVLYQDDTNLKNKYIIQLFICKKRIKDNTKDAYLNAVKRLIVLIDKPLDTIDTTDIAYYLNWYEKRNAMSGGTKNQATTVNNER